VGGSTLAAILGQKVAPGPLDIYLGRTGYEAQQYDGPSDPQQPDNLFHPVPGAFGAHGDFDDRAHDHSPELWIGMHRWMVGIGVLGAAGIYQLLRQDNDRPHHRRRHRRAA
jgi:hypothetical protein